MRSAFWTLAIVATIFGLGAADAHAQSAGVSASEPSVDAKTTATASPLPGTFIGPDGGLWRMEGCAAYPVADDLHTIDTRRPDRERQAKARSTWTKPVTQ